jgi:hypothetical protein
MFPSTQAFSGTYLFAPSAGEIIMNSFNRIQVRPTEINGTQLQTAVMELNLLLAGTLGNLQPNLWTVDLQTLPLTQSQATYSIPAETVMITNAYVRTGTTQTTDRLLFPMSQTEYAALADKASEGTPTQFWFNRLISPTITLYLVPDGNGPYTIYYYRVRQVQDAQMAGGLNVEVPYLWLDAITAGLAFRLARIYKPELEDRRKIDAQEAWDVAATQNTENVPMYITPEMGGYFR